MQTIRNLEDEFDFKIMMEAERIQIKRMLALAAASREASSDVLLLTSGACTLCEICACLDVPCRFPARRYSSMEAFGLMVSEACAQATLQGPARLPACGSNLPVRPICTATHLRVCPGARFRAR